MTSNQVKYFLTFFLIFFIPLSVLSQSDNIRIELLAKQLQTLSKKTAPELAYIQTNKSLYETLEDLWFKVYLLDEQTFTPSNLSSTLYLQMINENTRQVFWEEKYEAQIGFASGHIYLCDSLPEGNYLLAAYTTASFLGDSSEMKAFRRIMIKKEVKEDHSIRQDPQGLPDLTLKGAIQFNTFPEGGNLVSGIKTKLAFKAINKDGTPVDIKGTLFEDTLPLVLFKSTHAGLGRLDFTPVAGKRYHIRIDEPAIDSTFLLPEIYSEGISLRLASRNEEFLEFIVTQSPSLTKNMVYLRGQVRGIVYCMAMGTIQKELNIKIPLKEFTSQGIAEFTLFNHSLVPVAERLVYVKSEKKLHIETQLSKERYETREKVTLKINVKDENSQPVMANLGMSVYDKLYYNPTDPENIISHCYLTSQLRGKIFDPAYYFNPKNEDSKEALDLLLLTQGWRKYVWGEPALKEHRNTKHPVIFDGVEGKVQATTKLKIAKIKGECVMASNPALNDKFDILIADSTGKFIVTPADFKTWQGSYFYLKPMAPEEFNPIISLIDPFETIHNIVKTKEIDYPLTSPIVIIKEEDPMDPYIKGHSIIKLDEVMIKGYRITTFRDKYIGRLDSIARFNSCKDYVCRNGNLNCPIHRAAPDNTKPVEGTKYPDYKGFKCYPEGTNDATYNDGTYTDGKGSMIYHYKTFTEEELLKMNNLWRIKAYYPHREFYQPNYDNVDSLNDPLPDFRNTLFWEPSVTTDDKGEATVEFYCSDINTRFVCNIEGVSNIGLLGRASFEFFVIRRKTNKN